MKVLMQKSNPKKTIYKRQSQRKPGLESNMDPHPVFMNALPGCNKLAGKKCIITGGDSGIGRAVAVTYAKEGAEVAIVYLKKEEKKCYLSCFSSSHYYLFIHNGY